MEPASYTFPTEEELFQRRVIMLRSANEVASWWIALHLTAIIALSIIGAVAFAWPDIVERVNSANQETLS